MGTLTAPTNQVLPLPADGKFKWTGPSGATWEVTFLGSPGEPRYSVVAGQTLTLPLPPETKSIQANARVGGRGGPGGGRGGAAAPAQPSTIIPLPADSHFKWTAPGTGTWEITFVRHVYRSSPTRAGQREDGTRDKDSLYSLIDYLDPEATAAYIKLVPETYGKYSAANSARRFSDSAATRLITRVSSLDAQAARHLSKAKRLRPETLHRRVLRHVHDGRDQARLCRLF